MNDREQMQALLEGKVLMCDGERYKLDEDGDLVQCVGGESWCKIGGSEFMFFGENYVVGEGCVDFGRAVGMMSEGKVMRSMWSEVVYRIEGGVLGVCSEGWGEMKRGFGDGEMRGMWVEVGE